MTTKLLANENFPLASVEALRDDRLDVAYVAEDAPGGTDEEVLARARTDAPPSNGVPGENVQVVLGQTLGPSRAARTHSFGQGLLSRSIRGLYGTKALDALRRLTSAELLGCLPERV